MTKNIAHSRKIKLLNIAQRDNKRYQQLLVRYFHECFLRRLSMSPYREHLILKGGSLLFAFEDLLPRPTLDIDFTGNRIDNDPESLKTVFAEIMLQPGVDDGVIFFPHSLNTEAITVDKKYPGTRISFKASLDTIEKTLVMDIGFGDVITPGPVSMKYPTIFDESGEICLSAYSLETVVAEKFQTLIDRSVNNSRMKDFFDLYRILSTRVEQNKRAQRVCFAEPGDYFGHHIFYGAIFLALGQKNRPIKNKNMAVKSHGSDD